MPRHRTTAQLTYTQEVAQDTAHLYPRVAHVIPEFEWALHAPYINAINRLKHKLGAVVLAHNYMTPEIFNCVGDFAGDSLQLAKEAARTDAKIIVQAGVHFMAETSKMLSPEKTVLIPSLDAGCSLASSISGRQVRQLKALYPGVPVVTYVNTSAEVKAESDICCTSSNAVAVVESLSCDQVIVLPDQFLAKNIAALTDVEVITWDGACEVHEQFTASDIRDLKGRHTGLLVLSHPECPPEVVAESDFAGSTAAMVKFVKTEKPEKVALITECSMSDNVAVENPDVDFIKPCNLCPHMKQIQLRNILKSLQTLTHEVQVPPSVRERAARAVRRMVELPSSSATTDFSTGCPRPVTLVGPKDLK